MKSLITSFGLDGILFQDKKGGDVDTLVTVRDSSVGYSDKANEVAYNNRGGYNSHAVHSDTRYINANQEFKAARKGNFELGKFLRGVSDAFKKAFQNVKEKFRALIASFKDGALSGIMASITTTIINMFAATAKSVSFVYFLDHSEIIKKLTAFLDSLFTNEFRCTVEFFKEVNMKLDRYLAELVQIDYATFAREIIAFREINARLYAAKDERELNRVLHAIVKERGISMPYDGLAGLDAFMANKRAVLVI